MKNERNEILQSAEIKHLMHTFFTLAAPVFYCRPGPEREAISQQLLELVLSVCQGQAHGETCRQLVADTDLMHSAADRILLRLEELPVSRELLSYYDMKAACLEQPGLSQSNIVDIQLLPETLRQSGINGLAWAIRTGACMNYLEADPWCNRENAIRMWKTLAFSGDVFAMRALEYAFTQAQQPQQAALWQQTRQLCENAAKQFLTVIPATMAVTVSGEAAEQAQLILSIRAVLRQTNGYLPLPMLQYAAESADPLQQKLHNLCAGQDGFQLRLVQERKNEGRQFGF